MEGGLAGTEPVRTPGEVGTPVSLLPVAFRARGPLSSLFWTPPRCTPGGLPPPSPAHLPTPHSFQALYKRQFPHGRDVSSVEQSQCLACLAHLRCSIVSGDK